MKKLDLTRMIWVAIAMLILVTTACGGVAAGADAENTTVTSRLSQEQVTGMAENALQAFNAGDYTAWSRDWSDTMKAAIKESDFLAWREGLMNERGKFLSITRTELIAGQSEGFVRWVFTADFEQGPVKIGFGFPQDGDKIEGVFPEVIE